MQDAFVVLLTNSVFTFRQFYTLSKKHHPDRNPNDSTASDRFVKINDAYHILGSAQKRQAYDREHLNIHQHAQTRRPTGSYSSTGPAGGRPASGLSRRKTQFRGPPPSFYRSGGWGEHSAKRQAAMGDDARPPPDSTRGAGGMGPSGNERGYDNVPHFDKASHHRTQQEIDTRRADRAKAEKEWAETDRVADAGTLVFRFLGITFVLGCAFTVPAIFVSGGSKDLDRSVR
jgi:curved DNA-binding protein CbpA